MDPTADLRHRAVALRALAGRLDGAAVLRLDDAAGEATWVGAAATEYLSALWKYQHDLLQAADDLRWLAWQLDASADELDAASAAAVLRSPATGEP